jgi:hypothetical protein
MNTKLTAQKTLDSLNHYESNAAMIRSDREAYERSRMYELEQLLLDPRRYLDANPSITNSRQIDLSSCFVALAAPSMEGKTQSAFVFRDVLPLYFPLSHIIETKPGEILNAEPSKSQYIYENYQRLSFELSRYAHADLADLTNQYPQGISIGAKSIKTSLSRFPSRVLGFLLALIDDAQSNEIQVDSSWMRYHATRPDFSFRRLSINDIECRPSNLFKGFVLFLDEFVTSNWAIYVRNLARAVGLSCLVANTNSKVANLVGSENCSGSSDLSIWSIVVISLGPTNIRYLNDRFGLSNYIQKIKQNASDPGVEVFLDNFVDVQLKHLRPGIAAFVAEAIVAYANKSENNSNITLMDLLDNVLKTVSDLLIVRKFNNCCNLMAQCAKIGLLLSESYDGYSSLDINDYSWLCSGFSFLQDHLYHLVNPLGRAGTSWIFLTCPPATSSSNILQIVTSSNLLAWNYERTCFNQGETCTILACMFLPFGNTITDISTQSKNKIGQNYLSVHNVQNPSAPQRNGNLLEVSAAISIIDASQHSTDYLAGASLTYETFSLGGQNGLVFIRNLLINLINVPNMSKFKLIYQLKLNDCKYNIENFLKSIKIPFLYSLNRSDAFLDQLESVSDSIYLKNFERTANSEEIDGKFEIKVRGKVQLAVMECKNRVTRISTTILDEILIKCSNVTNSKLFLVFCDDIAVSAPTSETKFIRTCNDKKVNVYRVKKFENNFNIIPFYEKFKRPKYICIVFESLAINM